MAATYSVLGLCAGIGGIELGLRRAGHKVAALCEVDRAARAVLEARFTDVPLWQDVLGIRRIPRVDVLAAGFPCKDFSQAGRTEGANGRHFALVDRVLGLVDSGRPAWVLLENVPFMIHLHRGRALRHILGRLSDAGYVWAYRVVDAMAFGLPQRRPRLFVLASRVGDPREVLLSEDAGPPPERGLGEAEACGFYWTEGRRGLGLAVEALPPLKCSSSIDLPAPPAVWIRGRGFFVPDVRDGERLQGFPSDWTAPVKALDAPPRRLDGIRWRLVGNAVAVPVSAWLGRRLSAPKPFLPDGQRRVGDRGPLPRAAWGWRREAWAVPVSPWPVRREPPRILDFLRYPLSPLSERACSGFLSRARQSRLRFPDGFLSDLERQANGPAPRRA